MQRRDIPILLVLAALPIIAHAPAWIEGRALAPGEGTALHLPLRAAVWQAWARHELPGWNPGQFCGAPLLAEYRAGALYPPMMALAVLSPFDALQCLVLISLALAGVLTYVYARRLHAGRVGAYVAGLTFALGPYLVGHLANTPAVIAAPLLPLLLLAAESHLGHLSPTRSAGLSVALALLLLAGSPEAACAGAVLLAGRIAAGYLFPSGRRPPLLRWTALTIAAGILLSAPQLIPSLMAAAQAGPGGSELAGTPASLPGALGLVFRYISHSPSAALALAALPLLATHGSVRALAVVIAVALALQGGQAPNADGVGPLLLDFCLSLLAGVALGAQWRARRTRRGYRLRLYFLFFSLAASAALSISATVLGPLSAPLTGPVGILAFALILYFPLAGNARPLIAGLWLLPLTVSFLLQPQARDAWREAALRRDLEQGSPTRTALDHVMALRRGERMLTLASQWPGDAALDLAFDGTGVLSGHTSVNGYGPLVPWRTRLGLAGMTVEGLLPASFYGSDPALLDVWGARWVQVPSAALEAAGDGGEEFRVTIGATRRRLFPLPMIPLTEVRLDSSLADGVDVEQGTVVAHLIVRLASGRGEFAFPIRAGLETAEWAYDRADVRARVRHERPAVARTWSPPGQGFEGHRYRGTFRLPGRYHVDAVLIEGAASTAELTITGLGLVDTRLGTVRFASSASAYLSDAGRFRQVASTPAVHLFERPGSLGRAWVASELRSLSTGRDVLARLSALGAHGLDPYRTALAEEQDIHALTAGAGPLPAVIDAASLRRAAIVRSSPGRLDLQAEGPGWLVVSESWDRGWRATRDGAPVGTLRVDQMLMAVPLSAGPHHVSLRYWPPGLTIGLVLAALTLTAMIAASRRPAMI